MKSRRAKRSLMQAACRQRCSSIRLQEGAIKSAPCSTYAYVCTHVQNGRLESAAVLSESWMPPFYLTHTTASQATTGFELPVPLFPGFRV